MPMPRKRDAERRNRATPKADKILVQGTELPVKQPRARSGWRPEVRAWYRSLANSAQAVFYEDSDWQTALVAADALQNWYDTGRTAMYEQWRMTCSQLMVTEGERRKNRLEIHRNAAEEMEQGAKTVQEYRARLGVVS